MRVRSSSFAFVLNNVFNYVYIRWRVLHWRYELSSASVLFFLQLVHILMKSATFGLEGV